MAALRTGRAALVVRVGLVPQAVCRALREAQQFGSLVAQPAAHIMAAMEAVPVERPSVVLLPLRVLMLLQTLAVAALVAALHQRHLRS